MTLPKSLTTVTPFSKLFALWLYIFLPFAGLYFGMQYQMNATQRKLPVQILTTSPTPITHKSPKSTVSGNYIFSNKEFSFEYPATWHTYHELLDGYIRDSISYEYFAITLERYENLNPETNKPFLTLLEAHEKYSVLENRSNFQTISLANIQALKSPVVTTKEVAPSTEQKVYFFSKDKKYLYKLSYAVYSFSEEDKRDMAQIFNHLLSTFKFLDQK